MGEMEMIMSLLGMGMNAVPMATGLIDRYRTMNDPMLEQALGIRTGQYNQAAGNGMYGDAAGTWGGMYGTRPDGSAIGAGEAQTYNMYNQLNNQSPYGTAVQNYMNLAGEQAPQMMDSTAGFRQMLGQTGGAPQQVNVNPALRAPLMNPQTNFSGNAGPASGGAPLEPPPTSNGGIPDFLLNYFNNQGGGGGIPPTGGGTPPPSGGGTTPPWWNPGGGGNGGTKPPITNPWGGGQKDMQMPGGSPQMGQVPQGGQSMMGSMPPPQMNMGMGNTRMQQAGSPQMQNGSPQMSPVPQGGQSFGGGMPAGTGGHKALATAGQTFTPQGQSNISGGAPNIQSPPPVQNTQRSVAQQYLQNPQAQQEQVLMDSMRRRPVSMDQNVQNTAMGYMGDALSAGTSAMQRQARDSMQPGSIRSGAAAARIGNIDAQRQGDIANARKEISVQAAKQNFQDKIQTTNTLQGFNQQNLQNLQQGAGFEFGVQNALANNMNQMNAANQSAYNQNFANQGRVIDQMANYGNADQQRINQLFGQIAGQQNQGINYANPYLNSVIQAQLARITPSQGTSMQFNPQYSTGGQSTGGNNDWMSALAMAGGQWAGAGFPSPWG